VNLTTSKSPDVIIVFASVLNYPIHSDTAPPNIVGISDGTGSLSFLKRISIVTPVPNGNNDTLSEEEWYAAAKSPLTSDVISVKLSGDSGLLTMIAFGVAGANTSAPFDPSSDASVAVTGTTQGTISAAVSTTCPNDMIIGGAAMYVISPGAGPGFGLIQSDNGASTIQDPVSEYQVSSSPQANLEVSFTGQSEPFAENWVIIADAIG
jgi:hypothetical protein